MSSEKKEPTKEVAAPAEEKAEPKKTGSKIVVGINGGTYSAADVEKTLRSLASQTPAPDAVYVATCSDQAARVGTLKTAVRACLPRGMGKVVVLDDDLGNLSSLVCLLMNSDNSDPETLLVTVKTGEVLAPNILESFAVAARGNPALALCRRGVTFPGRHREQNSGNVADVILSRYGAAYPRSIFGSDASLDAALEDMRTNSLPLLAKNSDIYVSAWMDKLGVPIVSLAPPTAVSWKECPRSVRYLVRQMRSHGLLCRSLKVKTPKSTVIFVSALLAVALGVAAIVAAKIAKKYDLLRKLGLGKNAVDDVVPAPV
jgi:hypothetical protein